MLSPDVNPSLKPRLLGVKTHFRECGDFFLGCLEGLLLSIPQHPGCVWEHLLLQGFGHLAGFPPQCQDRALGSGFMLPLVFLQLQSHLLALIWG